MFEACIDKRTGEIVVVKPQGSPWSDKERDGPALIVVKLDDPDLKLDSTVKAYPYAVMGLDYDDAQTAEAIRLAGILDPDLKVVDTNGDLLGPPGEIMLSISRWKIDPRELVPGKSFRRADLKERLSDYAEREVLRDR